MVFDIFESEHYLFDADSKVVCMLMKEGGSLGIVVDASCVALVGKKQFKMTAMDIAGDGCSYACIHYVFVSL